MNGTLRQLLEHLDKATWALEEDNKSKAVAHLVKAKLIAPQLVSTEAPLWTKIANAFRKELGDTDLETLSEEERKSILAKVIFGSEMSYG